MKSFSFSDMAVYTIAGCALVMVGLALRNNLVTPGESAVAPRPIPEWKTIAAAGRSLGASSAQVSVVEFSDFQCPFCSRVEKVLKRLRSDYPNSLKIAYLHYPLTARHPFAYPAAVAAECAGAQNRFEEYHDVLFEHSDSIGHLAWDDLAKRVRVPDIKAFQSCVKSDAPRAAIERNVLLGRDLALLGTPAFIIDGRLFPAGLSEIELDARVRAVVANH